MILIVGEILFDLFPESKQMGGAPFNFAFHLKKLGFPVRFFSRIGQDDLGSQVLEFLQTHGFDTNDIQVDPEYPTGTVQVNKTPEGHSFSILPDTAWSRIVFDQRMSQALASGCDLIYLGSLLQYNAHGRHLADRIMEQRSDQTRLFCDINLRPGFYHIETIMTWLPRVNLLKLSQEEAVEVLGDLPAEHGLENSIRQFMGAHGIELVLLTLGEKGSRVFLPEQTVDCRATPVDPIVDTVGAGDAYAAVFAAGFLSKLPMGKTMALAADFSGQICTLTGAIPEDERLYRKIRQEMEKK